MAPKASTTKPSSKNGSAPAKEIIHEQARAGDLTVDHRVQRDHLNQSKLTKIRDAYKRSALGTLVVSRRADGTMVILDGQHRWHIVMELEGKDALVDCSVHTGLTLQEEAELFVHFNVQEAASPLDLHKARVTQGERVAVDIDKAAKEQGWVIGAGTGRISAIKVLEKLYLSAESQFDDYGPTLIRDTIAVITVAWGIDEPQAANANILKAVGNFLLAVEVYVTETERSPGFFDLAGLALAMQMKFKGGAKGWLASQRGIASGSEKTLGEAMMESLLQTYNKTRRSGKLPSGLAGMR